MSNNTNLYRSYKLAYQDRTIILKRSVLAILILACFSLGSLVFVNTFQNTNSGNLVLVCLFWIIGLSLLPIIFLTTSFKNFLFWDLILSLGAFIPLLINNKWNKYVFIACLVVFLFILISRIKIKSEYNNLLDLKWIRIVNKGSFEILLALLTILISLTYFYGQSGFIEQGGIKILDTIFSRSQNIQSPFGFNLSGTVDDILKKNIEEQGIIDLTINQNVLNNVLNQAKSRLSEILKFPITGKEKLSSLVIEWIRLHWQHLSFTLKIALSIFIFLIILSLLKFLNIIFSIILTVVSWIFLQILLSLKYLKIKRVGVEKQEVIIA